MDYTPYLDKLGRIKSQAPLEIRAQYFFHQAQIKHNNKFDYTHQVYLNSKDLLEIVCPIHGPFWIAPGHHLNKGIGCSQCSGKKPYTSISFQQKAQEIHGDLYDYSKVVYVNNHTQIEVVCKYHGSFFTIPNNHLSKRQGCPSCANHNINTIYIMQCSSTGLIKIGVTGNINQRLHNLGGDLKLLAHKVVMAPHKVESELHQKYAQARCINTLVKSGNTEFFRLSELQIKEVIAYVEHL